jgi:hypothetical protein
MLYHNKKRNVGLLNDFFAKYIANALVEQKHSAIEKATALYKKHFLGSAAIAQEWKLFKALYETNVSSKEAAAKLVERVRTLAETTLDSKVLELEKTKLIHEINNSLGDKNFFAREVSDYKLQASIQVLLNNWRDKRLVESLTEMANLEDTLLEHLCRKKDAISGVSTYLEMDNSQIDKEIDGLVVSIMSEKFNSKFGKELFEEQKNIVSNYVFSKTSDQSKNNLKNTLENIRETTLKLVDGALTTKKLGSEVLSEHLSKKFMGIKNLLLSEYRDTSKFNDETIMFYMTLVKLQKELSQND